MPTGTIEHQGEPFLRMEIVAELYGLEQETLLHCYRVGLLGEGHVHDGVLCLATTVLTRVASIARLHLYLGVSLEDLPQELA